VSLYQLLPKGAYRRISDQAAIPVDPANRDYQEVQAWLAAGGLPLPLEKPTAQAMAAALRQALATEYAQRVQLIAAPYDAFERESWHVQILEAMELQATPDASVPWITAAATTRGVERLELAQRIRAKDQAYRQAHGLLTGNRQRIETAIDTAGTDLTRLSGIDVTAGWPAAPGSAPH
jgi:hypothetical protein